jgi:hypothetical protein
MVCRIFLVDGFVRFAEVFCEKRVSERGILMVNLWWFAWWAWYLNGHVLSAEKCDTYSGFIFGDSVLGLRNLYRNLEVLRLGVCGWLCAL